MGDFQNKRHQALDACKKVIEGIEDGSISVSSALLLCKRIARLVNDVDGQEWLSYEYSGYPKDDNGLVAKTIWEIGAKHGRAFMSEDKKKHIFMELAAELEGSINTMRTATGNYSTRGFSVAGEQALLATERLTHRVTENTNNLIQTIGLYEKRLQILKAQYYDYAAKWQIELSFGNTIKMVFDEYREAVDLYFSRLPMLTIQKLNAIEDMIEDDNPERYAQVLASCRRLWSETAKHLFGDVLPDYNQKTFLTADGKQIDVSGDHDNNKLSAVIETLQSKAAKNTLVGSTMCYLIDWMEQISRRQNTGVHANVTRDEAIQCIIHTYVALGDILRLKNDVEKESR